MIYKCLISFVADSVGVVSGCVFKAYESIIDHKVHRAETIDIMFHLGQLFTITILHHEYTTSTFLAKNLTRLG